MTNNSDSKTISAQEIFDTVVNHLRKQGKRAVIPGTTYCAYRTTDGFKCAIGCLISDREYVPNMEGGDVGDLLGKYDKLAYLLPHKSLLCELQDIHDGCGERRDLLNQWERRWKDCAKNNGVIYTPTSAK